MGLFDFFKKKKKPVKTNKLEDMSVEEIFKMAFQELAQESPSRHFVSGAVFDLVRQNRDSLEQMVRMKNLPAVQMFFMQGYTTYLRNPRAIGAIPDMVNPERNDTNPGEWNFSVMPLRGNDQAVLCFMPIRNSDLSARIFGVVLGDREDGYYYCMLKKGENVFSDVARNKALAGVETIGAVKGRGFELINSFVDCIKKDFYKANDRNSCEVQPGAVVVSKMLDRDRIRFIDQIANKHFLSLVDKKGLYADNKFTDRFYVLYSNYQILLEKFLLKELPLREFNRKLIHSGLRFLELSTQKKDVYHRLSGMGMEFIYLRNYLHVEKLPEHIISRIVNLSAKELASPDSMLMDLIRRTYQHVLSAAELGEDVVYMVCYGLDDDEYWHDSRDLVFGVIHDERGDNGLGEGDEWLDNYNKQLEFLGDCMNELDKRCSEALGIKVHFLYYDDIITEDTMPM